MTKEFFDHHQKHYLDAVRLWFSLLYPAFKVEP